MEVADNKEAGTVVSVTPSPHTPGALTSERARVLLTKYKSYADAHLFNTEQCTDMARLREMF